MNQYNLCISILMIFFFSVRVKAQDISYKYDGGIWIEEKPDTTNLSRYMEDNEVYKAHQIYVFSYRYLDSTGQRFYFKIHGHNNWELVPEDLLSDSVVTKIRLRVLPDLGSWAEFPEYDQSIIEYTYLMKNGEKANLTETTGLIENAKNIWMHPPRSGLFGVLEINPFPFIQTPYKKGTVWKWDLNIGEYSGDKRWVEWKGLITSKSTYEIIDTVSIQTELGILNCLKVKAISESSLGKTELTSYFNQEYGFVRLDYLNIDKSQILLDIISCVK